MVMVLAAMVVIGGIARSFDAQGKQQQWPSPTDEL
jgi:hypothetical protein